MPITTTLDVPVTAWYLQNTKDNHYKDYTVFLADNGVLAIHWGKIDTAGQAKIERYGSFVDAKRVALRQVYAKASKGYEILNDEVKFTVPEGTLLSAANSGSTKELWKLMVATTESARYGGDRDSVYSHYDKLIEKAETLMSRAASAESFDSISAEFEALEKAWDEIGERHDQAATTVQLVRQMLMQKLISG